MFEKIMYVTPGAATCVNDCVPLAFCVVSHVTPLDVAPDGAVSSIHTVSPLGIVGGGAVAGEQSSAETFRSEIAILCVLVWPSALFNDAEMIASSRLIVITAIRQLFMIFSFLSLCGPGLALLRAAGRAEAEQKQNTIFLAPRPNAKKSHAQLSIAEKAFSA
jgi:hypothetical protein